MIVTCGLEALISAPQTGRRCQTTRLTSQVADSVMMQCGWDVVLSRSTRHEDQSAVTSW